MSRDDEVAVWTGRFSPFHMGHLALLQRSLELLPNPHLIMLTVFGSWDSASVYSEWARHAYSVSSSQLELWERFQLAQRAINGADLGDRTSILSCPRHDLDWRYVSSFYPPRRIICLTDKDEFESVKFDLWSSRGERICVLPTRGDTSADRTLTTARIKELVHRGGDWRWYLPPACHEYFHDIDGPRRVFGSPKLD